MVAAVMISSNLVAVAAGTSLNPDVKNQHKSLTQKDGLKYESRRMHGPTLRLAALIFAPDSSTRSSAC